MNIFLTSRYPIDCARDLDDLRLNKMILETGQMLCTAYVDLAAKHGWQPTFDDIYKPTHVNHPCSVWLRKAINNYAWGLQLFTCLAEERLNRIGEMHLTYIKLFDNLVMPEIVSDVYRIDLTGNVEFTFNCSNVTQFELDKHLTNPKSIVSGVDVFTCYKVCLAKKWTDDKLAKRIPKWAGQITGEHCPSWLTEINGVYKFDNYDQLS